MIDLDKLSALEKAAKRGPWYAWLKPVHTPDKCITTVPAEQFLREYKEAEKFNAELSERIGHAAVSDEWKNRYLTYDEEVIGCSEWPHAENADLLLIVEMRNQLPDLIARIAELEAERALFVEPGSTPGAAIGRIRAMEKRNADLEAQVAALKEIAVEGWAVAEFGGEQEGQDYHLYFREWNIDRESYRKEARELLQAEHPEAFR